MRTLLTSIFTLVLLPLSGEEVPAWAADPPFAAEPPPAVQPAESARPAGAGQTHGTDAPGGTDAPAVAYVPPLWLAPEIMADGLRQAGLSYWPNPVRWSAYGIQWQAVMADWSALDADAIAEVGAKIRKADERREAIRGKSR